jgi:hypothetical protein
MAMGGSASQFSAIPNGGAGSGATARVTLRDGEPIWGQRGRGVLTGEVIHGSVGQQRGTVVVEVDGEVDGEVHGAAAELEEAETGPKDGRSGPSAWRRLAADGEPVVAACVGGRGRGAMSGLGSGEGTR